MCSSLLGDTTIGTIKVFSASSSHRIAKSAKLGIDSLGFLETEGSIKKKLSLHEVCVSKWENKRAGLTDTFM